MGLTTSLTNAVSGLRVNQDSIDILSRNIANSGTPGYHRQALNIIDYNSQDSSYARSVGTNRAFNSSLQAYYTRQVSDTANSSVRASYLDRLQGFLGKPGTAGSLDGVFGELQNALQGIATSPDDYNSRAQAFQILARCPQVSPIVDVLTYWIDMVCWFMQDNRVVEVYARGNGEIFRAAGHDMDDLAWAILTFADGAVVSAGIAYALPEHYPTLGQSPRLELVGTHGVLNFEDEQKNHFLYSEQGALHGYVPNHAVKAAFLGSSSYGDWAQGSFWGPLADETRAFVEFIRTGNRSTIPFAAEARRTLEITLAIEESARTRRSVTLPVAG